MIRLTGGEHRGRLIKSPPDTDTRPTQAKLRQALFNSLQLQIPDARVLDLFSGAGTLGFEAISRGASHVTFVESGPVARMVLENAKTLDCLERIRLHSFDVKNALGAGAKLEGPFDIVLADPPYSAGWETRLLEEFPWQSHLALGGLFCLEWGLKKSKVKSLPDETPFLVKIREKTYGDSCLTTYRKRT